jgi:cell division protein WhiA
MPAITVGIKDELAHLKPRKKCDRLAELSALVRLTGSLHLKQGGFDLALASPFPAVARKTLLLLKDLFDIDVEVVAEPPSAKKHRANYFITVPSQRGLTYTLKKSHILDEESHLTRGIPFTILGNRCCQAAYVRGAFLAAGSVTGTSHGYHLEISTSNGELAEDLLTLLEELGFPAKLNERAKDFAVYLTDADSISDLLALIGAHQGRLELENRRIVRSLKNKVNRIVNAETANLRKTAGASVGQVKDIKAIEAAIGVNALPPALRDLAQARLRRPEATTAELGDHVHPPASKSAVYHRLRRLRAIARDLAR